MPVPTRIGIDLARPFEEQKQTELGIGLGLGILVLGPVPGRHPPIDTGKLISAALRRSSDGQQNSLSII